MFRACLLARRVGQPGLRLVCTGHLGVLGVGGVQGEKVPGLEESELAGSGVRPEQSKGASPAVREGGDFRKGAPALLCMPPAPAFWLHPLQSGL